MSRDMGSDSAPAPGERHTAPTDRLPVISPISKRLYRLISQSVCPWNVKFSQELAQDSPFAPRDTVTLATDILALDQEQFSAAFRKSPMKRAKLRRNAAVVLVNVHPTVTRERDA